MQFSIRAVMILVLFAALSISARLQLRSAARARAQTNALMAAQNLGGDHELSAADFSLAQKRADEYTTHVLDQYLELINSTTQHFDQAAAKIRIQPVTGKLSVLELPVIRRSYSFPFRWEVYTPDTSFTLAVDFVDANDQPQTSSVGFDDQSETQIKLKQGSNLVEVDFQNTNGDQPGLLEVKLNGDVIVHNNYLPNESNGASSRGARNFIDQQDFQSTTSRVELMYYMPNPGDTVIRVQVKRVQP